MNHLSDHSVNTVISHQNTDFILMYVHLFYKIYRKMRFNGSMYILLSPLFMFLLLFLPVLFIIDYFCFIFSVSPQLPSLFIGYCLNLNPVN